MPFEFTATQDRETSSTPVHVHPATILSSDSAARVSRRSSFAITPMQHDWIIECSNTLSIPPTHDPFLDHALLIQVIINGTSTQPAGAKMDSNLKKLKQRVQGFQADCECRTNQIFRLQFLIMAFPDVQWLKSSPVASRCLPASSPHSASPVTTQPASTPITPQGIPLRDNLSSRSRSRPSSNARAAPLPNRPSRPHGGPFSPVRTSPSLIRSSKSRGRPPSAKTHAMAMPESKSSSKANPMPSETVLHGKYTLDSCPAVPRYQISAASSPDSFNLRDAGIHLFALIGLTLIIYNATRVFN